MEETHDIDKLGSDRAVRDHAPARKISLNAAVAAFIRLIAQGKGDCQDAEALIFALSAPSADVGPLITMLAGQHGLSWEITS